MTSIYRLSCTLLSVYTCLVPFVPITSSPSCPGGKFYDGQECKNCTKCPPGEGAKSVKCQAKQDTVCYDCTERVDYSDVSSETQPCFKCPECHDKFMTETAACKRKLPTACGKCQDGQYYNQTFKSCQKCDEMCTSPLEKVENCSYRTNIKCGKSPSENPPSYKSLTTTHDDGGIWYGALAAIVISAVFWLGIKVVQFMYGYVTGNLSSASIIPLDNMTPQGNNNEAITASSLVNRLRGNIEVENELTYLAGLTVGVTLDRIAGMLKVQQSATGNASAGKTFLDNYCQQYPNATVGKLIDVFKTAENGGEQLRIRELLETLISGGDDPSHPTPPSPTPPPSAPSLASVQSVLSEPQHASSASGTSQQHNYLEEMLYYV